MREERKRGLIRLPIADIDYLAVEIDPNLQQLEAVWLRPVTSKEYQRGLELVDDVFLEMKANLRAIKK